MYTLCISGCKVYQNQDRLELLQNMIEFYKAAKLSDTYRNDLIDELKKLKGRDKPILFRCSERVEYGASGSPCINTENNTVDGMYIGAIPKKYYDALSRTEQRFPMFLENRVERAICTNPIRKAIEGDLHKEEIERHKKSI